MTITGGAVADTLLGQPGVPPKTVEKMSPQTREKLRREIAATPASAARERLLEALR